MQSRLAFRRRRVRVCAPNRFPATIGRPLFFAPLLLESRQRQRSGATENLGRHSSLATGEGLGEEEGAQVLCRLRVDDVVVAKGSQRRNNLSNAVGDKVTWSCFSRYRVLRATLMSVFLTVVAHMIVSSRR